MPDLKAGVSLATMESNAQAASSTLRKLGHKQTSHLEDPAQGFQSKIICGLQEVSVMVHHKNKMLTTPLWWPCVAPVKLPALLPKSSL